jgi:hypothetical protein
MRLHGAGDFRVLQIGYGVNSCLIGRHADDCTLSRSDILLCLSRIATWVARPPIHNPAALAVFDLACLIAGAGHGLSDLRPRHDGEEWDVTP